MPSNIPGVEEHFELSNSFHPDEDREQILARVNKLIDEGTSFVFDFIKPSASQIWTYEK